MISFSHVISIKDFSKDDLVQFIDFARRFENSKDTPLKDKTMACAFFEASTRTRLSFEASMIQLGGRCMNMGDPQFLSTKKGESFCDTIKVLQSYCDILVLRHWQEGAARLASGISEIPVINAGDGANQHPTQTLLDLYTISQYHDLDSAKPIRITLYGDLKYSRTIHSLIYALSFFSVEVNLVAPVGLELPRIYLEMLEQRRCTVRVSSTLDKHLASTDILYVTRLQRERFPDESEYERVRSSYGLKLNMFEGQNLNLKILHPLPRVDELDKAIDDLPVSAYFDQAANGVPVRKALLRILLS